MNDETPNTTRNTPQTNDLPRVWIKELKRRGLARSAYIALRVAAPLGVLGAQVLYMFQPLSGAFGWRHAVQDIARALETPDGIAGLLRELDDDTDSPTE